MWQFPRKCTIAVRTFSPQMTHAEPTLRIPILLAKTRNESESADLERFVALGAFPLSSASFFERGEVFPKPTLSCLTKLVFPFFGAPDSVLFDSSLRGCSGLSFVALVCASVVGAPSCRGIGHSSHTGDHLHVFVCSIDSMITSFLRSCSSCSSFSNLETSSSALYCSHALACQSGVVGNIDEHEHILTNI